MPVGNNISVYPLINPYCHCNKWDTNEIPHVERKYVYMVNNYLLLIISGRIIV